MDLQVLQYLRPDPGNMAVGQGDFNRAGIDHFQDILGFQVLICFHNLNRALPQAQENAVEGSKAFEVAATLSNIDLLSG